MDRNSRTPLAGGALLALSLIAGVVIGSMKGQPTIGFLVGLAIGVAMIVLVWLFDRMRR